MNLIHSEVLLSIYTISLVSSICAKYFPSMFSVNHFAVVFSLPTIVCIYVLYTFEPLPIQLSSHLPSFAVFSALLVYYIVVIIVIFCMRNVFLMCAKRRLQTFRNRRVLAKALQFFSIRIFLLSNSWRNCWSQLLMIFSLQSNVMMP